MARLAIKGHKEKGKEVIALLEMFGGNNKYHINITECNLLYTIREGDDVIIATYPNNSISQIFTIEEFFEKYPYKVGDKVNYVKYNDGHSNVYTIQGMRWTGVTIEYLLDSSGFSALTKDLQPYKEETTEDKLNLLQQLKEYFENTPREVLEKEWHEYDKYNEIGPDVIEYLEYVNNIRQPKYPKTYEECFNICFGKKHHIIQVVGLDGLGDYKELFESFIKLKICRDAYWKLYGEQMGLGKPWEPDWENERYSIYRLKNNKIVKGIDLARRIDRHILEFPSEEIQETFLENFNDLIEKCKEML